jgi:hypothetical protein
MSLGPAASTTTCRNETGSALGKPAQQVVSKKTSNQAAIRMAVEQYTVRTRVDEKEVRSIIHLDLSD